MNTLPNRRQFVPHFVALVGVAGLSGCFRDTRGPCENPPPLYVTLQASDRLNPDAQGQALSTQVQVLELKAVDHLEAADFMDVWQKPKETLGEDLLETREVTVDPSGKVTLGLARDAKATALAVVGIFRQSTGNQWRSIWRLPPPERCAGQPVEVKPVPGADDTEIRFQLEDYRVESLGTAKGKRT